MWTLKITYWICNKNGERYSYLLTYLLIYLHVVLVLCLPISTFKLSLPRLHMCARESMLVALAIALVLAHAFVCEYLLISLQGLLVTCLSLSLLLAPRHALAHAWLCVCVCACVCVHVCLCVCVYACLCVWNSLSILYTSPCVHSHFQTLLLYRTLSIIERWQVDRLHFNT